MAIDYLGAIQKGMGMAQSQQQMGMKQDQLNMQKAQEQRQADYHRLQMQDKTEYMNQRRQQFADKQNQLQRNNQIKSEMQMAFQGNQQTGGHVPNSRIAADIFLKYGEFDEARKILTDEFKVLKGMSGNNMKQLLQNYNQSWMADEAYGYGQMEYVKPEGKRHIVSTSTGFMSVDENGEDMQIINNPEIIGRLKAEQKQVAINNQNKAKKVVAEIGLIEQRRKTEITKQMKNIVATKEEDVKKSIKKLTGRTISDIDMNTTEFKAMMTVIEELQNQANVADNPYEKWQIEKKMEKVKKDFIKDAPEVKPFVDKKENKKNDPLEIR